MSFFTKMSLVAALLLTFDVGLFVITARWLWALMYLVLAIAMWANYFDRKSRSI
jgi:hypothetical protein